MANQVSGSNVSAYNRWVESPEIPVHEGYYVEDLRTLERVGGKNGSATEPFSS